MKLWKRQCAAALSALLALSLAAPGVLAAAEDGVFQTPKGQLAAAYNMADRPAATARWASTVRSYLVANGDGTLSALRAGVEHDGEAAVRIDTYSESLALLSTRFLPCELELFGGFFAGERNYYIAFGQSNPKEDDAREVIRLVKYDKDFNRISAASVRACYTVEPFDAGSLRMAEYGDELVLHTSRKRYKTEDGLNHQSQLTVYFDTDRMRVTSEELGRLQPNHVSHSFDQFVLYDGGKAVLLDHGDAYPRSVVLHKETSSERYDKITLLKIPGTAGANCTGVSLGGFEASESAYLAAISTIDHSLATDYDSYSIRAGDKTLREERDPVILAADKRTGDVTATHLAHYTGTNATASAPKLVPLGEDRFLTMWESYSYEGFAYDGTDLSYAVVDGTGRPASAVYTAEGAQLSDCRPIVWNNCVTWFVDRSDSGGYGSCARTFYQIELTDRSRRMLFTIGSKSADVFGEETDYDAAPLIINDRTMLPARFVAEALGATVAWDGAERKVTIRGAEGTEILLYLDSATAYVDGTAVTLDSPAVIRDDRTYTPVRFVAEALGAQVRWFGGERRVLITK